MVSPLSSMVFLVFSVHGLTVVVIVSNLNGYGRKKRDKCRQRGSLKRFHVREGKNESREKIIKYVKLL